MKSKKVLIVDDNALNRRVFEHIIGQLYLFEVAENGKIALEKLKISPHEPQTCNTIRTFAQSVEPKRSGNRPSTLFTPK